MYRILAHDRPMIAGRIREWMNQATKINEWMNEWILMSKRAIKASFKRKTSSKNSPLKFKTNRTIQAYKNVDTPSQKANESLYNLMTGDKTSGKG